MGNICELVNLVECMVIMFFDKVVDVLDLLVKYCYIEVEVYEFEYFEELMEWDVFNDIFSIGFSDYEDEEFDMLVIMVDFGLLFDEGIELKEYFVEFEISLIS